MKVSVKSPEGSTFHIEAEPADKVADVKKRIESTQGPNVYPADQQVLRHEGKVLKDETTLEENNILENNLLFILLRQNKGSSSAASGSSKAAANQVRSSSSAASGSSKAAANQPGGRIRLNMQRDVPMTAKQYEGTRRRRRDPAKAGLVKVRKSLKRSQQQLKVRPSNKRKRDAPHVVQYERSYEKDMSHNAQTSMRGGWSQDAVEALVHDITAQAFKKQWASLCQDMEKQAILLEDMKKQVALQDAVVQDLQEGQAALQEVLLASASKAATQAVEHQLAAVVQAPQQASAQQEALLASASQAATQAVEQADDALELPGGVPHSMLVTIEQTIERAMLGGLWAVELYMGAERQAAPQLLDLLPTVGVEAAPQQVVEEAAHPEIEEAEDDINLDLHL